MAARLGLKTICQRITGYQPVPEYNNLGHPAWCIMRAILERWIRQHPRPVLLVPIPLYHFVEERSDPSSYERRFMEVHNATGCFFHNPLPELQGYPMNERRAFRFSKDQHLTPTGHAALAKSLACSIRDVFSKL
jgi:carbamoyltransferase